MKKAAYLLFAFVLILSNGLHAQETLNQVDENGKRHGLWQLFYPNSKQLRLEGTYQNGKEIGTFSFYCETCKQQPIAVHTFKKDSNRATVVYFSPQGKTISKGEMENKKRVGVWTYFNEKDNKIMLTETYENDLLHGEKKSYYANGNVTEKANFKEGKLHGESVFYDATGGLIKKLNYENGLLHGNAFFYTATGQIMIEGAYNNGKEHGVWKYYSEGNLVKEEIKEQE